MKRRKIGTILAIALCTLALPGSVAAEAPVLKRACTYPGHRVTGHPQVMLERVHGADATPISD